MADAAGNKAQHKPPAILLMGPTASGKTALAIELRRHFPVDIISVDSALVYRGMDIGTAKPDAATLRIAPHALIDIREVSERYSVAEFREDALREMERITAQGRVPLLVGGTMLYFRALTRGLAVLPAADADVRSRLEQEAASNGWGAMHRRLAVLDPGIAERIHRNDPQRIQRALEVIEITGRKMSDLQAEQVREESAWNNLRIVACPQPRAALHKRIAQRFDAMLEQGFMEEMRALYARPELNPRLPSMRCVGYRQGWSHLAGEYDAAEMREKAIAATRQLAKRQLTWLRRESDAMWYDPTVGTAQDYVFGRVRKFLEYAGLRTNIN